MDKIQTLALKEARPIVFDAVVNNDIKTLRALLTDFHMSPSQRYLGRTALHHASALGYLDIVKLLISFDADIDALEIGDMSALDLALYNNQTKVVKYLASKSNYLIIHADYKDSIFYTAMYDNLELYLLLKNKGVSLSNSCGNESSLFSMSIMAKKNKIFKDLLNELNRLNINKEIKIFEQIVRTKKLSSHRRKLSSTEYKKAEYALKKLKAKKA